MHIKQIYKDQHRFSTSQGIYYWQKFNNQDETLWSGGGCMILTYKPNENRWWNLSLRSHLILTNDISWKINDY